MQLVGYIDFCLGSVWYTTLAPTIATLWRANRFAKALEMAKAAGKRAEGDQCCAETPRRHSQIVPMYGDIGDGDGDGDGDDDSMMG